MLRILNVSSSSSNLKIISGSAYTRAALAPPQLFPCAQDGNTPFHDFAGQRPAKWRTPLAGLWLAECEMARNCMSCDIVP